MWRHQAVSRLVRSWGLEKRAWRPTHGSFPAGSGGERVCKRDGWRGGSRHRDSQGRVKDLCQLFQQSYVPASITTAASPVGARPRFQDRFTELVSVICITVGTGYAVLAIHVPFGPTRDLCALMAVATPVSLIRLTPPPADWSRLFRHASSGSLSASGADCNGPWQLPFSCSPSPVPVFLTPPRRRCMAFIPAWSRDRSAAARKGLLEARGQSRVWRLVGGEGGEGRH